MHTVIGMSGLAAVTHLAIQAVLPSDFMVVQELSYSAGEVHFDRSIFDPATIADWTAVVVYEGGKIPICAGRGWGEYTPTENKRQGYPLDTFLNDTGCFDRLITGKNYRAYLSWVPRDGRDTVSATMDFTK